MGLSQSGYGAGDQPFSAGMQCTDVHIHLAVGPDGSLKADTGGSLLFPGPVRCPESFASWLSDLAQACLRPSTDNADFLVNHDHRFFRGKRENRAVDGVWLQLRVLADTAPRLDTLASQLSGPHTSLLLSPELCAGGLLYISGAPGSGKTTLASATVVSRLIAHGGMAQTIEDPPELPLNGPHGRGYCRQTVVCDEHEGSWTESLKGALRSQPVSTNLILFVGEVRDSDSAAMMLRAAANGFLVICTGFAVDISSGIEQLVQLAGRDKIQLLSQVLKIFSYQKLENGILTIETLSVDTRVSLILRSGNFAQLKNEVNAQRNSMIMMTRLRSEALAA